MNRYILIRRLRGPAVLLLLGVIALLHESDLVSWKLFVPLLLILIGVLKLAERAALAAAGDDPAVTNQYPGGFPGPYAGTYPGAINPGAAYVGANPPVAGAPQPTQPGAVIVPTHDYKNEGGQS